MNGLDLFLVALVIVGAFVVWLLYTARGADEWEAERERRFYDDVLGPPAPGSVDATLDEIRGLPEVPYDWSNEEAV